jgi:hypothetical protein
MLIRKLAGRKNVGSKISTHSPHVRKPRWLAKILPQMFTSVVAPLVVGVALQGFKGCDATSVKRPIKALGTLSQLHDQQRRPARFCAPADAEMGN